MCGGCGAAGLSTIGRLGLSSLFACYPVSTACLSVYFTSERGTARGLLSQTSNRRCGTWGTRDPRRLVGWPWSGGGVLAGVLTPDHGHCSLEPAAGLLALGARSGGSRWIVRCRSVPASCLPVTPPSPPLPCPVVLGQEPPLGFPRGWILFYCWRSPGAPASGGLGLPWPGLLTASRVVPRLPG